MGNATTWLAAFLTVAVLVIYEGTLLLVQRRNPARLARLAHADLREEWLAALSDHPGSEVLAVQTLRNSLMAATMTASTAALGLMGAVTLAAPSLNSTARKPSRATLVNCPLKSLATALGRSSPKSSPSTRPLERL